MVASCPINGLRANVRIARGVAGGVASKIDRNPVHRFPMSSMLSGMRQVSGSASVRALMLREIAREARLTHTQTGLRSLDPRVMKAMAETPRDVFVPEGWRGLAYEDGPLPIGFGQTISQPFIVALMTDLLRPRSWHRILEVGTGSGYQAAVLSHLVRHVVGVEIIPELCATARGRLATLGYSNVDVYQGDGRAGWPQEAPYDGILVTAAAREVPQALTDQLAEGGRMVIPVGEPSTVQMLRLIEKSNARGMVDRDILQVSFVPLVHPPEPPSSPVPR